MISAAWRLICFISIWKCLEIYLIEPRHPPLLQTVASASNAGQGINNKVKCLSDAIKYSSHVMKSWRSGTLYFCNVIYTIIFLVSANEEAPILIILTEMLTHLKIARPSQPVTCIILHSTLNASRSEVKSPIIAKYVLSSQEELQNWQLDLNIYNKIAVKTPIRRFVIVKNELETCGHTRHRDLAVVTGVKIWRMVNRKTITYHFIPIFASYSQTFSGRQQQHWSCQTESK